MLSSCTWAHNKMKPVERPGWFTCARASDCSIVRNQCGGPRSINRNYEQEFASYLVKKNQFEPCLKSYEKEWPFRLKAICFAGKCKLK
jgi:hypothetical protein